MYERTQEILLWILFATQEKETVPSVVYCGLDIAPISSSLLYFGDLVPSRQMLLKKTHLVEVSSSLLLWPLNMRNLDKW